MTIEDQPPPIHNDETPSWELVIADMHERHRIGIERYGTPLQAGNGRDSLVDLYQELLDAVVYTRTEIAERAKIERFTAWHLGQLTEVRLPMEVLEPMAARIRKHFGQE